MSPTRVSVLWVLPLVALGHFGCGKEHEPVLEDAAPEKAPLVELTGAFLTRAGAALDSRLKPDSKILEMRVTGNTFSVQMQTKKDVPAADKEKSIPAGSLVQLDYIERPGEAGQPPIGQVRGPTRVEVRGQGEVKDNLFEYSEVKLASIGSMFRIAVMAVDPHDGRVERLVIRRNLPFGKRVRGRIFVHSPRMSGSIDVNEVGAALKR